MLSVVGASLSVCAVCVKVRIGIHTKVNSQTHIMIVVGISSACVSRHHVTFGNMDIRAAFRRLVCLYKLLKYHIIICSAYF